MTNIYFIGIGGIGMSAIARYYKSKGLNVSGYDRTPSALTRELEAEGIAVHYEDRPDLVPPKDDTLVVYTPAIPFDLQELRKVQDGGYNCVKRSKILGEITRSQKTLAVAGTHGKTTTSTLTAHIIQSSGLGCNAFLGGISNNYDSNLLLSEANVVVAEADEFDRSFLTLYPAVAVITAMDADHLDIYGDHAHVVEAFKSFASQVSSVLIVKKGLPILPSDTKAKIYTYSTDNPESDFHAENIHREEDGSYSFDLVGPHSTIQDCRTGVPGIVNVENSIAAAAICQCHGVPADAIRAGLRNFRGVRRRFDIHLNTPKLTYIDDYAHHPEELSSALRSIRGIFPERHITAVFQPHLYTRTRDFAEGFARALSLADSLILLDIYPAREEPIAGVTSDIIFEKVTLQDKKIVHKAELLDYLCKLDLDCLVTFGAGDIDRLVGPITDMLQKRLED